MYEFITFNRYLACFGLILSLNSVFAGEIHDLIEMGTTREVFVYIEKNPECIHDRTEVEGNTPLHLAAKKGNLSLVEYLLKRGAHPHLRNYEGQIPLTLTNNVTIRELLRSKKSSPEVFQSAFALTVQSALALAIEGHNIEAARGTLSKIAPEIVFEVINQLDYEDNTPLIRATRKRDIEAIKLLLEFHAIVDQGDSKGTTPLMYAARNGWIDVVNLLLENWASIDLRDKSGKTALIYASRRGRTCTVTRLLEMGARVDLPDEGGYTPLMWADIEKKNKVVRTLVEWGVGRQISKPEIVEMFPEIQEISEAEQSSEWSDHFETPQEWLLPVPSLSSSSSSSSSSSREEMLSDSPVRPVRSFIYDPQNETQITNPGAISTVGSSSSGFTLQSSRLLESKPTSTYRQKRARPEARFILR